MRKQFIHGWLLIILCSHIPLPAFGQVFEDEFLSASANSLFEAELVDSNLADVLPAPGSEPDRVSTLEQQVHELQQRLDSLTLHPAAPPTCVAAPLVAPPPKYPNTRITGFFQLDAGWFAQDTDSIAQFGNIQDDRGFRRARLAAVGDVAENISYMIEMDFAFNGRPSFMDVFVDVHDVRWLGNVRIGQWRQPFGMDELNSVRDLKFLERPSMFAFAPFRQTGIGFHDTNADQTVTWAASGFGFPADPFGDSFGDRGYGTAERVTALVFDECEGRRLVHVGFDHAFTIPTSNGNFYRNVPEFGGPFGGPGGVAGNVPFFVHTGLIDFDHSNLVNLELAGGYDSFHWQSELRYAFVNFGDQTVTLPAYYMQAGYILTGEVRPYNRTNAVFGRIKPNNPVTKCGGWGAWEVAGRYSYIDLNPAVDFSQGGSGLLAGQPPGGRLNNMTFAVNWYLHTNLKIQFEYIRAVLDNTNSSSVTDIAAVRTQLDF